MARARILISNDDGLRSPGLAALAEAVTSLGEVVVVAPDRERSATSHSISLHRPLRLWEAKPGRWACDGTPTDAVYLGIHHVLEGRRPDLVLSGINMGANLGNDVNYSGTVAAALEGTLLGVPSIAVSLVSRPPYDFEAAARFSAGLAEAVLVHGLPEGVMLNVNVPKGRPSGYRITRQGRRDYGQGVEVRVDPRGRPYYWIGGTEVHHHDIPGSDCNAVLEDGLVSVTPLHLDRTAYRALEDMRGWDLDDFERMA